MATKFIGQYIPYAVGGCFLGMMWSATADISSNVSSVASEIAEVKAAINKNTEAIVESGARIEKALDDVGNCIVYN